MNRRQKIIVSVTGIFLVLLLLVGLTYAYFLTRITGNTNDKSISVKTANLALVYGDGNGILEVGEVLVPGDTVKFKTANGDIVDKKTFTVTNEGNATTDYVVVIDEVKVTYTSTVVVNGETHTAGTETTFESNDFVYTLTCTSGCNGVDTPTTFPIEGGILVGNSIDVEEEQTYELRMTYKETGKDQSNDMNKTLTARVNIKDISTINPYSSNTNTLAYNIINNAILGKTGTTLAATPKTVPAVSISSEDESILSVTQDDYGTSYYYRGNIEDNYLEFNNMCWRIVRIEGDGSIKITLAAQKSCSAITAEDTATAFIGTGHYGYKSVNEQNYVDYDNSEEETSSMKYQFNEWLNGTIEDGVTPRFSDENKEKIKNKEICIGDTETPYTDAGVLMTEAEKQAAISSDTNYYYNNYKRMYIEQKATLMCDTGAIKTSSIKIYPLTADEVLFAGGKAGSSNTNYYLNVNATSNTWWTLSPAYFNSYSTYDRAFAVTKNGRVGYGDIISEAELRPAISLITGTEIVSGGNGTITNPYVIQ